MTTVDEMSGGRVEVGVGAGWNEAEHASLGLAFPEIRERADLMEDELAILHGLWEEPDGWSFQGRQVRIESASFSPKPVQRPHPPIIVGGEGSPRSLRLAARYADEYNMSSAGPEACAEAFARLDEECRKIGRDPATMRALGHGRAADRRGRGRVGAARSATRWRWSEARGRPTRRPGWRRAGRAGSSGRPDQARAMVARFAAAGVERIMLQDLLPRDHGDDRAGGARS